MKIRTMNKPPISVFVVCLVILAVVCLALGGCAATRVKEGGRTVFATQANARELEYRSPAGSYVHIIDLDHSGPTRAGATVITASGNAATKVVTAAGSALVTGGLVP